MVVNEPDSSFNTVTRLRAGGVRFPTRTGNFSLLHHVQTGSGPTQPPIQLILGDLSPGRKQGREVVHPYLAWSYTSTPPYVFMVWYLVKHRDKFTFYPSSAP